MNKDAEIMINNINERNKSKRGWIYQNQPFGNLQPGYCFSNENLSSYYPFFNINNSDILTVTGSGDQVLMGILNGANKIDCFDSNLFAYYNLYFKLFAIKSLKYEDFCNLYDFKKELNREKIYEKINFEKKDVEDFYNQIFMYDNNFFQNLFIDKNINIDLLKKRISYFKEEKYDELQSKIDVDKIIFKNIDVFDILNSFSNKYSFINLSNIYDYCSNKDFLLLIKSLINNNLLDDGKILINYCWSQTDSNDKSSYIKQFLNIEEVKIDDVCINNEINPGEILVYIKNKKGASNYEKKCI